MNNFTKAVVMNWDYFLALAEDLEKLQRYLAFDDSDRRGNYSSWSIELIRLLLDSCSAIDDVAKHICKNFQPDFGGKVDICWYKKVLMENFPRIAEEKVYFPRNFLEFVPWETWKNSDDSPDWWRAYNDVKHDRSTNYYKATLENVLGAISGLLVILFYYSKLELSIEEGEEIQLTAITASVKNFIRLDEENYYNGDLVSFKE